MDTREVHSRCAVDILERIAASAAFRDVSKPAILSADSLGMQTYKAPHSLEERKACIGEAAYFIAMRRGFSSGHELQDWLAAETEVDARLIGAPREF